jgi:enoyl-CoA hydratase/carnithine racemase
VLPWTVTLPDPPGAARVLVAAAAANPQASLALSQVLRTSAGLDVRSALNAESFAYSTLLGGAEFRRWLDSRPRRPVPPPGPEPAVLIERTGESIHITLNRPARRNAYSRELRDALVDALLVPALDNTIRHVVIDGAGPSFCSGGDLDEFGAAPDLATAHFIRTSGSAAGLLHRIEDRTDVMVHGACVGAGIELPAFAGRIVARPGTTFRLPEVAMGLIPGAGGTVSIPRRIRRWRSLYLALSGMPLDAETALRWGLIDQIAGASEASR